MLCFLSQTSTNRPPCAASSKKGKTFNPSRAFDFKELEAPRGDVVVVGHEAKEVFGVEVAGPHVDVDVDLPVVLVPWAFTVLL